MLKRIAVLLACLFGLAFAFARTASAQTVRRLSARDIPVLANELRIRLGVRDTATTPQQPVVKRVSDDEFNALVAAAVQALHDLNDPSDLSGQEAAAATWGARDAAGADLRRTNVARRENLELLIANAGTLATLVDKYDRSTQEVNR
jgi:hypothetical protein